LTYRVELESRARREFLALPKEVQERLSEAIDAMQSNPRPPGTKRLVGKTGYRIRKGDHRILYHVDDRIRLIRIFRIGNRRDVYRDL
jgi:mRNA interferase RelE/StbE